MSKSLQPPTDLVAHADALDQALGEARELSAFLAWTFGSIDDTEGVNQDVLQGAALVHEAIARRLSDATARAEALAGAAGVATK